MRVALVVPGGVDPPGGERTIPFVQHLVHALSTRHELVVVAVGHDPSPGEWELFGAPVVNLPVGSHGKADVARVLAAMPRAVGRRGRPDVVHGLWANLPGLAAVVGARLCGARAVVSVCGGELAAVPAIGYGGGLRPGTRRLSVAALRGAHEVTVATEWMRAHVQAAGATVGELVPLGADLRVFHRPHGQGIERPFHLVQVAGRNKVKDQDLLLCAFAAALRDEPRLTLAIAGGDTLHGHHERVAHELGIDDRVEFLGEVAHDRLGEVLQGAALHVITSHHDAGPVSVLEAAACGVPTIGTSVGHLSDFAALTPGAAVVVSSRDPVELANGIVGLVRDRPRRDALADAAHHWATAHDADFTVAAFDAIYRRLAARSASA